MPSKIAVVCEARADFRTATDLADRVLCKEVDWITEDVLNDYREWRGIDDVAPFLLWRDVHQKAKEIGLRIHGHFDNQPAEADAQVARRALHLLKLLVQDLAAILLIRDDDRQTERRKGLEQARTEFSLPGPVVIGLAHLKRECWVLLGFESRDDRETSCLQTLIQELGFDPCRVPERLTDKNDHGPRSAKRVLRELTADSWEREEDCWRTPSLQVLSERGQSTGLAEYLEEIRKHLVPLFTGPT